MSIHAPLVIAEQFGTLESLYPGRIDLGVGRAPGGDFRTMQALRRDVHSGDTFPQDLAELQAYFRPGGPGNGVHAIPGEGLNVPIYLLGSSDFSARLAARLGLPFAFASHFAPDYLYEALDLYRRHFQPSEALAEPCAMVGVNVFAADTDAEAQRLFTSLQQVFLNIIRGTRSGLLPPVDRMDGRWTPAERARVETMTRVSVVGSLETVRAGLQAVVDATGADEIIATAHIYDHSARLHSFDLAAQAFRTLNADRQRASEPRSTRTAGV